MDFTKFKWTREPESCRIENDRVEVVTKPHTDLWQRTYYHFRQCACLADGDGGKIFQLCG